MVLKMTLMTMVIVREKRKNMLTGKSVSDRRHTIQVSTYKNGPTSRRRFVMKYKTKLKPTLVRIFAGKSHIIEAMASVNG